MDEEKVCKECRYYQNGKCDVDLWCNARKISMGNVPEDGYCELWEEKEK